MTHKQGHCTASSTQVVAEISHNQHTEAHTMLLPSRLKCDSSATFPHLTLGRKVLVRLLDCIRSQKSGPTRNIQRSYFITNHRHLCLHMWNIVFVISKKQTFEWHSWDCVDRIDRSEFFIFEESIFNLS